MSLIGFLPQRISPTWRYALLGGAVSLPFTIATYWQTQSTLSPLPAVFGGVLAGYLATRQRGTERGVGVRTGLISALPVLWMFVDMVEFISTLSQPIWFSLLQVGLVVFFVGTVSFLTALCGSLGAKVGNRLAEFNFPPQNPRIGT